MLVFLVGFFCLNMFFTLKVNPQFPDHTVSITQYHVESIVLAISKSNYILPPFCHINMCSMSL